MKRSFGPKILAYPTPSWVICAYDKNGKPTGMTVAWGGVCSSVPPCVNVCIRKATYTHECISARKAFTVNIPSEKYAKEMDHFGIASGRNEDKFAKTGLTAVKGEKVDAPYIDEFPIVLECKLVQTMEVGIHTMFIGEIVDAKADESVLDGSGIPDITKIKPIIFVPEHRDYAGIGELLGTAFSIGKTLKK
jgi:flavin reductase (DIM6/NTAB) family NADH-FMN oxidoreductase RutF